MNPSMLFEHSNTRLAIETSEFEGKVDLQFWTTNQKSEGSLSLSVEEAEELVGWIRQQIENIKNEDQ